MKTILFCLLLAGLTPNNPTDNLHIIHKEETITIINREDFMLTSFNLPFVDENKYNQLINQLDKSISTPAISAKLDNNGNIIQEEVGYRLNKKSFKEMFYTYLFHTGHSKIKAPLVSIYPRVDSELLANIRVQQIGYYRAYFNSRNKERSHNISLASEALNNYVIFPGETFSFNSVVGKRTKEKGYLPAPVIVRGELSEGIGGGICQVSSTLFNAVDRAGLEIVQRYSHSRSVPYVPPGRDATVSWYGPDFRFKNNYNQPILLQSKIVGGAMSVVLYSSEDINYDPTSN